MASARGGGIGIGIEDFVATIQNQLGRLEAANERATEDRREMRETVGDLHEVLSDLKGAVLGLTQSVQSMSNQVVALNAEKCGERLDGHDGQLADLQARVAAFAKTQEDVLFWQRIIGGGGNAIWKFAAWAIGGGTIGTLLVQTVGRALAH